MSRNRNYLRHVVGLPRGETFSRGDPVVVGAVERTPGRNVALRVGRRNPAGGWHQTEHLVLTVADAAELVRAIADATGGQVLAVPVEVTS